MTRNVRILLPAISAAMIWSCGPVDASPLPGRPNGMNQVKKQHLAIRAANADPACVRGTWALEGNNQVYVCVSWLYQGHLYTPTELDQVLAQAPATHLHGQQLEYLGYRIDLHKVAQRDDLAAIVDSIKHQIDLVDRLDIKPSIKEFFRSIPIKVEPGLGEEGHYSAQGLRIAPRTDIHDQPILLHEYLHAFHQKLPGGFQNRDIMTFYQRAKAGGFYPSDAYVLKNPLEFFAMTASAYLHGTVKRPPFSRANVLARQPVYSRYLDQVFDFKAS
jgi:hypothetical protein